MNHEQFVKNIKSLENILDDFNTLFARPRKALKITGGMSLQQQETYFDIARLNNVTRNMILDMTNYLDDKTHFTVHLKSTNRPNQMLLDGITRKLEEYFFLQCIIISDKEVVYHFKDPLDLNAVQTLLTSQSARVEDKTDNFKRPFKEVYFDDVLIAKINLYNIKMPYQQLINAGKLKEGFEATNGLVTRIHQDRLFDKERRTIYLSQYAPFFKLLSPKSFEDNLSEVLRQTRNLMLENEISSHPAFVETKRSRYGLTKGKVYRLNINPPEHLAFILAKPEENKILVGFECSADYDRIRKYLEKKQIKLGEEKINKAVKSSRIKKGGRSEKRDSILDSSETKISNLENETLLTFRGRDKSILELSTSQQEESFNTGVEIIKTIYYERMIYTGWISTSEMKTNLTKEERKVIQSLEVLTRIYKFLLEADEQRTAFAKGTKYYTALDWIYQKMTEVNGCFEERILNVLNVMDEKVDPETFYRYGKLEETQEKLREQYNALQKLKGSFEALVKVRSAGLIK